MARHLPLGSVHELNMRAVLDEPLKELRAEIGHLTAKRQNSDDQWLRLAVRSLRALRETLADDADAELTLPVPPE